MNILSAHWDVTMVWRLLSGTARIYSVLLLVLGSYAGYSLVRAFMGPGSLCDKAALTRAERRISNVRQIILLLLLLLGMTIANDALIVYSGIRYYSHAAVGDLDVIDGFGPWMVFIFSAFGALVFLHMFQWIAAVWLQRRAGDPRG